MSDIENELKLFHATPPRLLPQIDYHRPKIEANLARMAATNDPGYGERLEAYNALCDKYGVKPFGKVVVVVEKLKGKKSDLPESTEGSIIAKSSPAVTAKAETNVEVKEEKKAEEVKGKKSDLPEPTEGSIIAKSSPPSR